MFSDNSFIDERVLLIVIAVGTLVIYLFVPTPNVLYKEENQNHVIDFKHNTSCYDVKTTEVACPHEDHSDLNSINNKESKNELYNEPHNLNMNISE
jgi:hypothetical protein